MSWRADILTLFPEMFPGPLGLSLAGRALQKGVWSCHAHDLRPFGLGAHRALDDAPFGGGAGMVMRPDVLDAALQSVAGLGGDTSRPVVYPTPRGRRATQKDVARLARGAGVIVLCGRFEGVDERVLEKRGIEELCFSDFVLSGGEIPALALLDGCVRLLPGVMGSALSADEESFANGLLEYPHYTRPAEWEGRKVPEVLLSGHHGAIARWRSEKSCAVTRARRPDLWATHEKRPIS
ncbi:tRNA (guanosine(37)-N1)-methyltransferase TrmD [Oecophyllibacter saccharovorans]|uniref:tRNA (guanine-N(1)-)-methyltransferase n=1 Tax=Oecophyllibacter saccharovorans TaxID=2558360 RepID=A0A506UR55_9PROT|nr:tRNA (guanosine(37)-N1)-methyltransferase TrmD [Oecophyllibacter saccharovorans]QDH14698.1 tRNA (guanosine(37)-N1)-methyltransferase TrmD [Oecophyllibacter saccharovorans]TPW35836.1 tRNA (guanosine(37)-N1)-methyltransferase TrmD [Oecophyllibacter saccharovorans]